jgi:pimeloyl-ACP methyl ester carboxylesterase
MDALEIDRAHVHGTSMGGMIAIVFAGKYPDRTTSVVINCAAAKLGMSGRLVFKNWIDIARLDPDGPGSRILAELIAWQALSKAFLETPDGVAAIDSIQEILRDSNASRSSPPPARRCATWTSRVAAADHLPGARPRRRRGPDDAVGPGPEGAGQEAIYQGIPNAEKHVIRGSNHSTVFDNTEEHNRVVIEFFQRHSQASGRCRRSRNTGSSRSRPSCGRPAGATCSRSTSRSSSTRSCTCSGRSPSSASGCRFRGRSSRWSSGRRSPTR